MKLTTAVSHGWSYAEHTLVLNKIIDFINVKLKLGSDLNARCGEGLDIIQNMDRFNKYISTADSADTIAYHDKQYHEDFNGWMCK